MHTISKKGVKTMGLPEGWYGDLLERRPDDTDDTHIARKRAVMQVDIARVKAARAAQEAAEASPAAGGTDRAKGEAKPATRAAEVAQAVLWLAANNAGLPAAALAGLGLDTAVMAQFEQQHAKDLTELRLLQATARYMSRAMVGRLLVGRLTGQALTAQTPQDMAAVTRAFRSLPDWAWEEEGEDAAQTPRDEGQGSRAKGEDEEKAEGKRQEARVDGQAKGSSGGRCGAAATSQGGAKSRSCSSALPEEPPMNRAARRRMEKAERGRRESRK
jgi:hypothetical protein